MTDELYVTNRDDWHSWLERNYYATREVWLVYFKKHTGKPSIPYEDSVEEAFCFGWVDTLVRKLDDKRFARKSVPRKTGSKWSESNKKRAERIARAGFFGSLCACSVDVHEGDIGGDKGVKEKEYFHLSPSHI